MNYYHDGVVVNFPVPRYPAGRGKKISERRDDNVTDGSWRRDTYVYWFAWVPCSKRPWTPSPRCSRRCGIVAKDTLSWTWSRGGNSCRRSCRGDWRTRAGRHVPRENRNGSRYYPRAWTRLESRASAAYLSRLKRRKEATLEIVGDRGEWSLFLLLLRPSTICLARETCRLSFPLFYRQFYRRVVVVSD